MNQKQTLLTGAILMALAVGIGAFGAHGLKALLLANDKTAVFETAVKYHAYHALGMLLVGTLYTKIESTALKWISLSFLLGTLIFSGSLYTLAITNIGWLGAITPFGGVGFIVGWIGLAFLIWKKM